MPLMAFLGTSPAKVLAGTWLFFDMKIIISSSFRENVVIALENLANLCRVFIFVARVCEECFAKRRLSLWGVSCSANVCSCKERNDV